ncbi:unnamed protein product, partial [Iphiclides podalirius]
MAVLTASMVLYGRCDVKVVQNALTREHAHTGVSEADAAVPGCVTPYSSGIELKMARQPTVDSETRSRATLRNANWALSFGDRVESGAAWDPPSLGRLAAVPSYVTQIGP